MTTKFKTTAHPVCQGVQDSNLVIKCEKQRNGKFSNRGSTPEGVMYAETSSVLHVVEYFCCFLWFIRSSQTRERAYGADELKL